MSQSTKTSIAYGFNIATKEEGSHLTSVIATQLEKQNTGEGSIEISSADVKVFLNTLIATEYPSLAFEADPLSVDKNLVWNIFVARTRDDADEQDTNRRIEPTKEEIVDLERFKEQFRIAKGSDYLEWKEAESLVDA